MLMRYVMLVGVAAITVWGALNLGTTNANMVLVDAGQGGSANASLWILGLIAAFITISLCRFVIFGLPSMMDDWYRDNKSWMFVAGAGAVIYGMFYLI
jgi:hypothetical protein